MSDGVVCIQVTVRSYHSTTQLLNHSANQPISQTAKYRWDLGEVSSYIIFLVKRHRNKNTLGAHQELRSCVDSRRLASEGSTLIVLFLLPAGGALVPLLPLLGGAGVVDVDDLVVVVVHCNLVIECDQGVELVLGAVV